jgi:hypothetical protein
VKRILPAIFATVFLVVAIEPAAQGKDWKSKKSTPAPSADPHDRITAVHLTSIAISVFATHSGKEYKVTPATKITVNGQPAQLSGLATGMDVVVTPAPDGVTAATIDAKTRR